MFHFAILNCGVWQAKYTRTENSVCLFWSKSQKHFQPLFLDSNSKCTDNHGNALMKWLENIVKLCLLLTILHLERFVKTGVCDLENELFF